VVLTEQCVIRAKSLRIGKNPSATPLNAKQLVFAQKTYCHRRYLKENQMVEATKEYYLLQIKALTLKVTELEMALDDAHSKLMVTK
jgi:hypothetical protein